MPSTILDKIVATKRRAVAQAEVSRPIADVRSAAADAPAPRDLHAAIVGPAPAGIHVIAELKRRSPSAGVIRADFDPAALARGYESAGASAISVLTDEPYFDGKLDDLAVVKASSRLPALRKDFIIASYQVYESRAAGADALLLIGEVLEPAELEELLGLTLELSLTALVEVHEAATFERIEPVLASATGSRLLLGVNNRNLKIQQVDLGTTSRLAPRIAGRWPLVSESGVHTREDVLSLQHAGAQALLVGETLLKHADPGEKLKQLLGGGGDSQ